MDATQGRRGGVAREAVLIIGQRLPPGKNQLDREQEGGVTCPLSQEGTGEDKVQGREDGTWREQ